MIVEMQSVILAGGTGIRLYPLTENLPKSLLEMDDGPQKHPLLWYQLNLLEEAGFQEVFVVTTVEMASAISSYLTQKYDGKIIAEVVVIEANLESADALRAVRDRIKSNNFMVLAGDLVTNVPVSNLADVHRLNDANVTMLLKKETRVKANQDSKDNKAKKKPSSKKRHDEDMIDGIAIAKPKNRVVYVAPSIYVDHEDMVISKALLKECPNFTVHTNLTDAHFYIFSKWVLDLLHEKKNIFSIKADLIPHLVNRQFHSADKLPESVDRNLVQTQPLALSMSSTTGLEGSASKDTYSRCFAYIMDDEEGYCERADTLTAYAAMEKEVKSAMRKSQ